jgi:hypothetical protein
MLSRCGQSSSAALAGDFLASCKMADRGSTWYQQHKVGPMTPSVCSLPFTEKIAGFPGGNTSGHAWVVHTQCTVPLCQQGLRTSDVDYLDSLHIPCRRSAYRHRQMEYAVNPPCP